MKKKINFLDVSVTLKNKLIFQNFSFLFQEGKNVCLIGAEGVGKTTLLKTIENQIPFQGEILKEDTTKILLQDVCETDKTIEQFLDFSHKTKEELNSIKSFLNLKSFHYSINELNKVFQLKINLLDKIFMKPKFLFVDDILHSLTRTEKQQLIKLLLDNHITLFYVTSNIEDALFFPYLVVMGSERVLMEGNTLSILEEEKLMKRLGFSLPFQVDLSLQLQSYNLIKNIYIEKEELFEKLWKSD